MQSVLAEECIGQSCGANISINVTKPPITPIITTRTILGQTIYDILDSSGAGLGMFFTTMGTALPLLFFALVLIVIIIAVGYAIIEIFIKVRGKEK
jgi:hypothetical protein